MLLFYAAPPSIDVEAVAQRGLQAPEGRRLRLYRSLTEAKRAGDGPVLVVDPTAASLPPTDGGPERWAAEVPASALQNVGPYRPPQPVTAAGGYVSRPVPDDVALLLIHRRGVWDLPKGHRDPGESLATCARREVREEVGIDDVQIRRSLGTTQHAYAEGETWAVKTTYWYLMHTPERTFAPDQREGIRRVAWARWAVARRHIGYDTLRRHMDRVEASVRASVSDGS